MTNFGPASITAAEYAAMQAKSMREDALQALVTAAANHHGWRSYHTHDSRRSQPGFPDLLLIHPTRQLILYRELKTQTGRVRPEQTAFLADLTAAGADVAIWRPLDWFNLTIPNLLAGTTR